MGLWRGVYGYFCTIRRLQGKIANDDVDCIQHRKETHKRRIPVCEPNSAEYALVEADVTPQRPKETMNGRERVWERKISCQHQFIIYRQGKIQGEIGC